MIHDGLTLVISFRLFFLTSWNLLALKISSGLPVAREVRQNLLVKRAYLLSEV